MAVEVNVAVSAHTQGRMKDVARPNSTTRKIEDVVVPQEVNLYSHPLAGLLWERRLE